MKRKWWIFTLIAIVVAAGIGVWIWHRDTRTALAPSSPPSAMSTLPSSSTVAAYESGTYLIEGQPVTLVDGRAETSSAPGSASNTVTQYFGNEATGDLNGDGVPDAAFLLTQDGGGSGTFFYVAAALKTPDGYKGTNAVFLGDRIAPQTTAIASSTIIVNYADRAPNAPMAAAPSAGVTKYFQVRNGTLVEMQQ